MEVASRKKMDLARMVADLADEEKTGQPFSKTYIRRRQQPWESKFPSSGLRQYGRNAKDSYEGWITAQG